MRYFKKKLAESIINGDIGEVDKVLKLKGAADLLLDKFEITDYTRTFKPLTLFQYAMWTLDIEMCEVISDYLSSEQMLNQYNELMKNGVEYQHRFYQGKEVKETKEIKGEKNIKYSLDDQRSWPAHLIRKIQNDKFDKQGMLKAFQNNPSKFIEIEQTESEALLKKFIEWRYAAKQRQESQDHKAEPPRFGV